MSKTYYLMIFCYFQWFEVRGDCLFCWYWWNCWSSLFKLSLRKRKKDRYKHGEQERTICHGLFIFKDLRWKMIVFFFDIGTIVDHYCLNFPNENIVCMLSEVVLSSICVVSWGYFRITTFVILIRYTIITRIFP